MSITPFLISLLSLAWAALCAWLYWKKKIKTATVLLLAGLLALAGGLRFNPEYTENYRQEAERKTFERAADIPAKVEADSSSYEERMQQKHESLREESEEMINQYLKEEDKDDEEYSQDD